MPKAVQGCEFTLTERFIRNSITLAAFSSVFLMRFWKPSFRNLLVDTIPHIICADLSAAYSCCQSAFPQHPKGVVLDSDQGKATEVHLTSLTFPERHKPFSPGDVNCGHKHAQVDGSRYLKRSAAALRRKLTVVIFLKNPLWSSPNLALCFW